MPHPTHSLHLSYAMGRTAARRKLAMHTKAATNPLITGAKVEIPGTLEHLHAPAGHVWTPPPHSTSGTILNPKVAAKREG